MSAELKFFPPDGRYTRKIVLRDKPAKVILMPAVVPDLDHGLVEVMMSRIRKKKDRAQFWRDHIDILGRAFIERGISEDVVIAALEIHRLEVRAIHEKRMAMTEHHRAVDRSEIKFDAPPAIGTEIIISGKVARVVAVEPYTRKTDGAETLIIIWDIEGRRATSGLRAPGVYWDRGDNDGKS